MSFVNTPIATLERLAAEDEARSKDQTLEPWAQMKYQDQAKSYRAAIALQLRNQVAIAESTAPPPARPARAFGIVVFCLGCLALLCMVTLIVMRGRP